MHQFNLNQLCEFSKWVRGRRRQLRLVRGADKLAKPVPIECTIPISKFYHVYLRLHCQSQSIVTFSFPHEKQAGGCSTGSCGQKGGAGWSNRFLLSVPFLFLNSIKCTSDCTVSDPLSVPNWINILTPYWHMKATLVSGKAYTFGTKLPSSMIIIIVSMLIQIREE